MWAAHLVVLEVIHVASLLVKSQREKNVLFNSMTSYDICKSLFSVFQIHIAERNFDVYMNIP